MNTNTGDTTKNNYLAAIVCLMHSTVNQVYAIVMATHSAIEPLTPGRRNLLNFEYLTSRPISDSMMQSFLLLTSTILISCALWALGSALFFLFLASKMCYPLSLFLLSVLERRTRRNIINRWFKKKEKGKRKGQQQVERKKKKYNSALLLAKSLGTLKLKKRANELVRSVSL